jgi:hypothetical protein
MKFLQALRNILIGGTCALFATGIGYVGSLSYKDYKKGGNPVEVHGLLKLHDKKYQAVCEKRSLATGVESNPGGIQNCKLALAQEFQQTRDLTRVFVGGVGSAVCTRLLLHSHVLF